jgi:hypothetical protein
MFNAIVNWFAGSTAEPVPMVRQDAFDALEIELRGARETIAAQVKLHTGMREEIVSLEQTNYSLDRTAAAYKRERDESRRDFDLLQEAYGEKAEALECTAADAYAFEKALIDIANMETPHCAHIGKRMAGRAREALPGGGPSVRLMPAASPKLDIGDGGSTIITNGDGGSAFITNALPPTGCAQMPAGQTVKHFTI